MGRALAFLCLVLATAITFGPAAIGFAQSQVRQPTFAKDVAPIFYSNCVGCHRSGQSAPMSLITYQEARPWAQAIRRRVAERSMPPWSAEPGHRALQNERRLSQADLDTIVTWVDNGAPEGNPGDLPAAPVYTDEWTIGKPDVIFSIPQTVDIPAKGNIEIRYFAVPTGFTTDRWLQAIEIRPTDSAHVHHVIMYHRDAELGTATPTQDGTMALGSSLAVPGRDRTRLGLRFADAPPVHEIHALSMSNSKFVIPPGAADHEVQTRVSFNEPFRILSIMPHAHQRGKSFQYRLIYPDGRAEVILSVPKYDWRWETAYVFAQPVVVPPRTAIEVIARYDNSAANRSNPDPLAEVRWGWQPSQEMMFSYVMFTTN